MPLWAAAATKKCVNTTLLRKVDTAAALTVAEKIRRCKKQIDDDRIRTKEFVGSKLLQQSNKILVKRGSPSLIEKESIERYQQRISSMKFERSQKSDCKENCTYAESN